MSEVASSGVPAVAAPRARVPVLALVLAGAIGLGVATGLLLGRRAAVLGDVAFTLVQLLKLVATPLVFAAIVDALTSTRIVLGRVLALVGWSALNAVVAAAIALGVAHALPLGRFLDVAKLRAEVSAPNPPPPALLAWIAHALQRPLAINILWVIAAALATGIVLRLGMRRGPAAPAARVAAAISTLFRLLMRLLGWVVRAVPLAAFGVVAREVGKGGLGIFVALGLFVLLVTLGLALQVCGWYSLLLRLVARRRPLQFFRHAIDPLSTAFAAGSSVATLPVTLKTLEDEMGVSRDAARLAAVVGTNLNHDGIILYEAAAALFVAQLYGVDTTLPQQLAVVGASVLAAIGIAGVPDAGLITLSLVLGQAGLPLAAAPLLFPVDWFLGRLRAVTNVASDLTVANLLDRRRVAATPPPSTTPPPTLPQSPR